MLTAQSEKTGTEIGDIHEEVHNDTHDQKPHRIIAIAIDQSNCADYAFNWAVKNLINPETDQVVLLNVRPYITAPILYATIMTDKGDQYSKTDEANKIYSHNLIRKYAEILIKQKVKCKGVALRGDPREEIVYKVDNLKADVLVVGSRGMNAFKRAFVGSTSDYCVHNCHCTVIIPRQPVQ
ncbi:hypothetical protein HK099_004619 [Clydaea vesicula]|uniref:UspA domain-containing protein n=1 Tax=Clydaea vesicula TaxID=447962 RepID=A0AAD5U1Q6_9FUNG|nr:hypothetical protein HK099_004619 [Clydaea vesicula]